MKKHDLLVDAIVEQRPPLRHLFLGDAIHRESEISWIKHPNIERLFAALPDLETLRIRGSDGLSFGCVTHARLRTLIVESGGLHGGIARDLAGCSFPALEHLELWLGRAEYGARIFAEDLEPVLDPARFPRVDHLGLRNAEVTDEIAPCALQSPLVRQLASLDLSLGYINDQVAKAILGIPSARALNTIDVGHHSIRPELVQRLREVRNVVGLEHFADGEGERYTAIGE